MIENLDEQIGRLIKRLRLSGKMKNTLIIFTSDNGGVYRITKQWPLRAGKGSYYEGGIREPMFAYWEGKIAPNTKCEVPVSNLDFYPTILEAAGIKKPADKVLVGTSILSLLEGKDEFPERPLFWHFPFYLEGGNVETQDPVFRTRPGSAVRSGNWKLIQYFENNDLELYNLAEDIGEKNNLVSSEPEKLKLLLTFLEDWRRETTAPVPTELNPDYEIKKR